VNAAYASYVANAAKDDEACKEYVESKKAEIRTVLDEFNRLPSPLSEGVDKLITEKLEAAYAAKRCREEASISTEARHSFSGCSRRLAKSIGREREVLIWRQLNCKPNRRNGFCASSDFLF